MLPSKVKCKTCAIWHSLWRICYLLLAVVAVLVPQKAFAENFSVPKRSLFSLSLEQLVNIDCSAGTLDLEDSDDLIVHSFRTDNHRLSRRPSGQQAFDQVANLLVSKVARHSSQSLTLFIDGYEVGSIDPVDVYDYLREISGSLIQAELYTGDSVTWWSKPSGHAVLNFVTSHTGIVSLKRQHKRRTHGKRQPFHREEP